MPTAISITRGVFQVISFSLLTETGKPYERATPPQSASKAQPSIWE
jgi:hypothetical protein